MIRRALGCVAVAGAVVAGAVVVCGVGLVLVGDDVRSWRGVSMHGEMRWWAHDADGRPCAWPVPR